MLIGGIINYLNLGIAAPEMMKYLHLSNFDIGLMGTVFSWTYAFMQLPADWFVDRFGAKWIYSIALLRWSVATFLIGICSKMSAFIGVRVLLGIGESPCWPASAKITSQWFPKKERGFATGIWDSSSKLGPAIAPPLVSLMLAFGWRAIFFITGAIGIVFVIIYMIFYRKPEDSKRLSAAELAYIREDEDGERQRPQSFKSWVPCSNIAVSGV